MSKNTIDITLKVNGKEELNQLNKASSGAANSLNQTATTAHSADRAIKGTSEQSANATKNFSKMSQGISGGLVRAYATLAANIFAASAAFNFLRKAADYGSMLQAQKNFAANTGVALESVTTALKKASRGMLDYGAAAKIGGLAVAAGLNTKQLEDYAKSARSIADVLGEDYETTVKRLVKATASGRTTLLREIGVTVDANRAKEAYAKTLGKTAASLTEFEQKQALITETQKQLNQTFGDSAATANPFDILLSSMQDIVRTATQQVLPVFEGIANVLSNSIMAVVTVMGIFAVSVLKAAIPIEGIKTKFAGWQASAVEAAAKSSAALKALRRDIKDNIVEYQEFQKAAREAMGAAAKQAVAGGSTNFTVNKVAAGKSGIGTDRNMRKAFKSDELKAELDKATKNNLHFASETKGIFKGISTDIILEMKKAFEMAEMSGLEFTAAQSIQAGRVSTAWQWAFNNVRLAAARSFGAIAAAANMAGKAISKAMRALSWVGIGSILVDAFLSVRRNIADIARSALGLFIAIITPIEQAAIRLKGIVMGVKTDAEKSVDLQNDLIAATQKLMTIQANRQRRVDKGWAPALLDEWLGIEGKAIKKIADIREEIATGVGTTFTERLEKDLKELIDKFLVSMQDEAQAAAALSARIADVSSSLKAASTDMTSFKSSLSNSTDELHKQNLALNAISSLSFSSIFEKLVSDINESEAENVIEELKKSLTQLNGLDLKIPGLAQLAADFDDAILLTGDKRIQALNRLIVKFKETEQGASEAASSAKNFGQLVSDFKWDNLASGSFKAMLGQIEDMQKAQKEAAAQSRKMGQETIARNIEVMFSYDALIEKVRKLVAEQNRIELDREKNAGTLNLVQGLETSGAANLRDELQANQQLLVVDEHRNNLAGLRERLSQGEKELTSAQTAELKHQVSLTEAKIKSENAKLAVQREVLGLQKNLRDLQDQSKFLEQQKQLLDIQNKILEAKKSMLDIEKSIFLEQQKAANLAVGVKGSTAAQEYEIWQKQRDERITAINAEADMKLALLDNEYSLQDVKFKILEAEMAIVNARIELANREKPEGTADIAKVSLGFNPADMLKGLEDAKKAQAALIEGQRALNLLQHDNEGLEKGLAVTQELSTTVQNIIKSMGDSKLSGFADTIVVAMGAVVQLAEARKGMEAQQAAELIAIEQAHAGSKAEIWVAYDNLLAETRAQNLAAELEAVSYLESMTEDSAQNRLKIEQDLAARKSKIAETHAKKVDKIGDKLKASDKSRATSTAEHQAKSAEQGTQAQLQMGSVLLSGMGGMFSQLAAQQDQSSKKGFETAKKLNLASAVMGTAAAIMNALSTVQPYPAAVAAAAMAAAVGAAQIAAIQSTSFEGGGSAPSVSGGGGGGYAATTGGVLGDPTKSSESSKNSLEFLDEIHAKEYSELRGIHSQIQKLNTNITNLATQIARNYGVMDGSSFGVKTGTLKDPLKTYSDKFFALSWDVTDKIFGEFNKIGKLADPILSAVSKWGGDLASSIFGGKVKQSITESGFRLGAISVKALQDGMQMSVEEYARAKTRTSGGWLGSSKTRYADHFEEADFAITKLFNDIFGNIGYVLTKSADMLGGDIDSALAHIFDFGKIDLKGLKGDELTEKLEAAINTASDDAFKAVFGEMILQYQNFGEGLMETAIRLIGQQVVVQRELSRLGTSINLSQIWEEDGSWRDATEQEVKQYVTFITNEIAQLAGGLEKFQEMTSNFFSNFFSEAEQFDDLRSNLTSIFSDVRDSLADIDPSWVAEFNSSDISKSRDAYRELAAALDVNTEEGREAYVTFMEMSEAASAYYDFIEAAQEKQFDLEISLLESQGYAYQALSKTREKEIEELRELDAVLGTSLATIQANINAQEDANALRSQDIELIGLQGRTYEATQRTRIEYLKGLSAEASIKQLAIYAQEDLNAREALFIEILGIAGRSVQATNIQRRNEITALNATGQALMRLKHRLQDIQASVSINSNVMSVYSKSLGDHRIADRLTGINRALVDTTGKEDQYKALWLMEDAELARTRAIEAATEASKAAGAAAAAAAASLSELEDALKKAIDAVNRAYEAVIDVIREQLDKLAENISMLESVIDSLTNAIDSIVDISVQQALDQIKNTSAAVRRGDFSGLEEVEKFISVLTSIDSNDYATSLDMRRDERKALLALTELREVSEGQLAEQLSQEQLLENQIKILEAQRDTLLGIDNSVLSIAEATSNYHSALSARDAAKAAADAAARNQQSAESAAQLAATASILDYMTEADAKWLEEYIPTLASETELLIKEMGKAIVEALTYVGEPGDSGTVEANVLGIHNNTLGLLNVVEDMVSGAEAAGVASREHLEGLIAQIVDGSDNNFNTLFNAGGAFFDDHFSNLNKQADRRQEQAFDHLLWLLRDISNRTLHYLDLISRNILIQASGISQAIYNQTSALSQSISSAAAYIASSVNLSVNVIQVTNPEPTNTEQVPAFAGGGIHSGGYRIVGESGPELEYTNPSRIYSNNDTAKIFDTTELVSEIRELRRELNTAQFQIAKNTKDTAKVISRWEGEGMPASREE